MAWRKNFVGFWQFAGISLVHKRMGALMRLRILRRLFPKHHLACRTSACMVTTNQRRTPGILMKGTVKAAVYASVTLVVTTLALMSEGAPLSAVSQRDPLV